MSQEDQQDETESFDQLINEEDIVQVIELDENRDVADDLQQVDIDEDANGEDTGDEIMDGMEASAPQIKDLSDLIFTKHTDAVFSVSLDPKSCDLAVTGGQDDKAFVWRVSTGEVIFECTGHKDSITSTGFSHDGVYAATADLGGLIKVWKVETRQEIWSFECSDIEWLKWHPVAHVLLVGTVDGDVWMWKIPGGDCKTFQGPGCTASCGMVMSDGKRACVGYDDGSLRLWDLKGGTVQQTVSGHGSHKSTVVCLDCHPDNSLIMSGSTDVTANIVNSSSGKIIGSFDCRSSGTDTEEDSVEAVGFSHVQNHAATGTVSGVLSIWDINTQICRQQCKHEAGIVKLYWDRLSPLLYTSSLDGIVRLWDSRNGQVMSKWTGHTDAILDFEISKDGNSLVTVSEDNTARVFSLHSPDR